MVVELHRQAAGSLGQLCNGCRSWLHPASSHPAQVLRPGPEEQGESGSHPGEPEDKSQQSAACKIPELPRSLEK